MKLIKKLLTLSLILFLLTGCVTNNSEVKTDSNYYLNELRNYKVKEKNINNTEDNKEFSEFEDEVFRFLMSLDYLTLNSQVYDYKALNIEKPERVLFELNYGETDNVEKYEEFLKRLESFDYNKLSYSQQYDYDYMRYDMITNILGEYYLIYEQMFNISNDIIGNVIVNLEEYRFTNKEALDDYLELLDSFPACFESALDFTKKQYENGLGLTDTVIEYNVDEIDTFIEGDINDNQLLLSVYSAIDSADIDVNKDEYKTKIKSAIEEKVIPTLVSVKEELETYKGKTSDENTILCNINKDFAEYVFYSITSTNENPKDYYNELKEFVAGEINTVYAGIYDEEAISIYGDVYDNGLDVANNSYEKIIDYLKVQSKKAYPDIGEIPYTIKKLDYIVQDTVLAYYVPMPVDNIKLNTIKVNGKNIEDGSLDLYTTLAHEGIPGHLYQFYYYALTNPCKYRMASSQIAYVEGHTVSAQREALNWIGIKNSNAINFLKYDTSYYFFLYSLVDIGIEYLGLSQDEIINDLVEIDPTIDGTAGFDELFSFMVGCPGQYLSYGGGGFNFARLRNNAENELGNKFNLVEFNKTMLKNGPLPYALLKQNIDEYINENK